MATIAVRVVHCPRPGVADEVALHLPEGATLREALVASGMLDRHPATVDLDRVGVWGRLRRLDEPLRDGDRVELYRALVVDPKEARRLRYRGQRKRAAAEGVSGSRSRRSRARAGSRRRAACRRCTRARPSR